jgi:hypothetical protein
LRKLSLIMALGFLATSFAFAAAPASARNACGRHMHWVPAHRDRMGHWVRGHCAPDRR